MRVQHNILAMNAYRNYTNNTSAMQKNLEKLSSGFKINRAGDDAAGLAISEKMRAQITGLETAQKNAKDGISLVQTAEGALTEVHDMLNRMVELATQSANGTYSPETDREQLQKEIVQLRTEINRIADSANFNGIKLLDGSMDGEAKTIKGMEKAETIDVTASVDGSHGGGSSVTAGYEIDLEDYYITGLSVTTAATFSVTFSVKIGTSEFKLTGTVAVDTSSTSITAGDIGTWTVSAPNAGVTTFALDGVTYTISVASNKISITAAAPPKGADSIIASAVVSATHSVSDTNGSAGTDAHGWDAAVHPTSIADYERAKVYAKASFQLTKEYIKDGAKLTIGSQTYTIGVGKDGVSGADIDLTDYEADDENLMYFAAMKIAMLSNDMFDISTGADLKQGKDAYTIELREKGYEGTDYNVDYAEDWDLSKGTKGWNKGVADGDYEDRGVVTFQTGDQTIEEDSEKALTLQIGDTAESHNQLKVYIGSVKCDDLGIGSIDISEQTSAQKAIDKIKAAINQVSDIRGTLGATQNRLDHTINNLSVMTENIQDAESTIRDTDVAEEMMAYTKNNILIQAAQAMLAQANQIPQGVLQLLQ